MSFLWLCNCILKAVSPFSKYWILQSSHSGKYMMKLFLEVAFRNILNVLLVWLLLKWSVFITCLQQNPIEFEKQGEHFLLVNLLAVGTFFFFSIVFRPINCLRLLFLRKTNRAYFEKPFWVQDWHSIYANVSQVLFWYWVKFCSNLRMGWGDFPFLFSLCSKDLFCLGSQFLINHRFWINSLY